MTVLHGFFMLYRYGQLPIAPVFSDELTVNDASISLARGTGYAATSLSNNSLGLNHLYAHFPPLYPAIAALVFRTFGVSVYSLRLTTTVMSIASTIVLLWLLYLFVKTRVLAWDVALLVQALYCSNGFLISLDRIARMESMVNLLVLLALVLLLRPLLLPSQPHLQLHIFFAAVAAAACLGVHPESITALMLLGVLLVFVVPASLQTTLWAVALAFVLPILLVIVFFGAKTGAAIHQFLYIFSNREVDPTVLQWLAKLFRDPNISLVNNSILMAEVLLLLIVPMLSCYVSRQEPDRKSFTNRIRAAMFFTAALEFLFVLAVFRINIHRYQFLFGPLLVLDAICFLGQKRLRPGQKMLGWSTVGLQLCSVIIYLAPRADRVPDMNPDRFLPIVQKIPAGASLAVSAHMWLDLRESRRAFTVLMPNFDGGANWKKHPNNPLEHFDAIVLVEQDWKDNPWREQAVEGRDRYVYRVGSQRVEIYLRRGMIPATGR